MSLPTYQEMLNGRLHIGHLTSKWNPRFSPYILTKKGDRHIIDLKKTHECMQIAAEKMKEIVQGGGKILFVGTKKQAKQAVIQTANELEAPYIAERWLGGTLTNFRTIYKSIKQLSKIEDFQEDPIYKNLTKKEQSILRGKHKKLQINLEGIKDMKRPPHALFIVDIKKEVTVVKEAKKLGIPIFAIVDTNSNPTIVDYPIPANDDSKASIQIVLEYIMRQVKPSVQIWKDAKKPLETSKKEETVPKAKSTKEASNPLPKAKKESQPIAKKPLETSKKEETVPKSKSTKEASNSLPKAKKESQPIAKKPLETSKKEETVPKSKSTKVASDPLPKAKKESQPIAKKSLETPKKEEKKTVSKSQSLKK